MKKRKTPNKNPFISSGSYSWGCACAQTLHLGSDMLLLSVMVSSLLCSQNSSWLPSDLSVLCSWALLWRRQSELNVVLTLWWGVCLGFLWHTLASNCSTGCQHVGSWLVGLHDCGFGGENTAEITIQTLSDAASRAIQVQCLSETYLSP